MIESHPIEVAISKALESYIALCRASIEKSTGSTLSPFESRQFEILSRGAFVTGMMFTAEILIINEGCEIITPQLLLKHISVLAENMVLEQIKTRSHE